VCVRHNNDSDKYWMLDAPDSLKERSQVGSIRELSSYKEFVPESKRGVHLFRWTVIVYPKGIDDVNICVIV
jgi:hypothetical protein